MGVALDGALMHIEEEEGWKEFKIGAIFRAQTDRVSW
jgi:hypothetical protein